MRDYPEESAHSLDESSSATSWFKLDAETDLPSQANQFPISQIEEIFNLKWENNSKKVWSLERLLDVPQDPW